MIKFDAKFEANNENNLEHRMNKLDKDYKKLSNEERDLKF